MMPLDEILTQVAIPRPNASVNLEGVREFLVGVLSDSGYAVVRESFVVRPYMQAAVGIALVFLAVLAVMALRGRLAGLALVLALLVPLVYLAEFEYNVPVVSWVGQWPAENLVVDWSPPAEPGAAAGQRPLVILSAHYDSKTDVLDHYQRQPIYAAAPLAMGLLLLTSLLGVAAGRWNILAFLRDGFGRTALLALGVLAVVGLGLLAYSFAGGYFVRAESPGARDDGTSVAILAGLAAELPKLGLEDVDVRIILFAGEEVNCQGSAAYVAAHPELDPSTPGARPVYLINLECLAGGGNLAYHDSSGTFLKHYSSSDRLVELFDRALATGTDWPSLTRLGFQYNDSGPFMRVGIPAITITQNRPGQLDSYHNAGDNLDLVVPGEMERILRVIMATLSLIDLEAGLAEGGI